MFVKRPCTSYLIALYLIKNVLKVIYTLINKYRLKWLIRALKNIVNQYSIYNNY